MEKYFQWQHWRVRHLKLFQSAAASRGEYNIKRLHLLKTLPLISNTALRLRNTVPLRGSHFHDTFPGLIVQVLQNGLNDRVITLVKFYICLFLFTFIRKIYTKVLDYQGEV